MRDPRPTDQPCPQQQCERPPSHAADHGMRIDDAFLGLTGTWSKLHRRSQHHQPLQRCESQSTREKDSWGKERSVIAMFTRRMLSSAKL
jgi:hypothetical protein